MPIDLSHYEVWFVTGSQHLYGEDVLRLVARHGEEVARTLGRSREIPARVICKAVLTTPEAIAQLCQEANASPHCVGLIAWMHTFSPARMWIGGLKALQRPLLHLHTQFNRDIPWSTIDMDFMNLNQSAHGDREFGFICTRLDIERKVVVGHYPEADVQRQVGVWARAACAWRDGQGAKIVRFGDNMRQVAVTEGDKVEAEVRFGYSVNGWGVGDLAESIRAVADDDVYHLVREYRERYLAAAVLQAAGEHDRALREAARIELGLRAFLEAGGFKGFTTTFEDLHGLSQLPGLAVQRLMADGYGYGAEGDWKTAALLRAVKVMSSGLPGGASFMEDYTYHFDPAGMKVLGAHMLEVCESIADGRPKLEIAPLSIGGKSEPPRLVFDVAPGSALNASIVDLGDRFRMIVNEIDVVASDAPLSRLPVARAVWRPRPDLPTAASAWILAGGSHHSVFTKAIGTEYLIDYTEMAGIELLTIDAQTCLPMFKRELRWNRSAYSAAK